MRLNVGAPDRVARIILGVLILAAGFFLRNWWGLIGLIPLATAFVGYCPLYTLLGISTRKKTG